MLTSLKTRIAANTLYQLVGKVVSMAITILATVLVVRYYGRDGYGAFSLMQNIPALFFIIADFGINAVAVRELSKDWSKAAKYFNSILTIRLLLSLVLMTLVGIGVLLMPYEPFLKIGIYLSLPLILTQALFATTNIMFQPKLRYDLSTLGYVSGSLLVLVSVFGLTALRAPLYLVSLSYVAGGLVTYLVNLQLIKRLFRQNASGTDESSAVENSDYGGSSLESRNYGGSSLENCNLGGRNPENSPGFTTDVFTVKLTYDPQLWRYLFVQTLPLGLMFVFSQINFKVDSLMLSMMRLPAGPGLSNIESVAIYGLPYKIFEVCLVVPTFFMNAVFPVFVGKLQEGKKQFLQALAKSLMVLWFVAVLAGLAGYIAAPYVIRLLGGDDFGQSVWVLRVLLAGLIVFFTTQPLAWVLVALEKQKYLPAIYLISAVFNVLANALLIPVYSFYASAVITVVSELLILVLLAIFVSKSWKDYV